MSGIPYNYDYINQLDSRVNPSGVTVTNTKMASFFRRYLLQKAMSVFKWTLPEHWSKDYFLYVLYCWGHVAIINTDKFGVIPQHCSLSGYTVMYQPRTVNIANPLLKGGQSLVIGEQCTLFKMASDYGGIMDLVNYYADLMALASQAMGVNLINSKLAYVFGADSQSVAESFKKAADKVESGEPFVVVDKKLTKADGNINVGFFQQNLKQNFITNELLEVLQKLANMFATEIGIPNSNAEKKERLIVDEVNANNVETMSRCDMWLDSWKDSCKKANKMFGIEMSVDWRVNPYESEVANNGENGINQRFGSL